MDMSTSNISCAIYGTLAENLGIKDAFTCRCCDSYQVGCQCWEWRDGSWLCTKCVTITAAMFQAGESKSTQALAFLSRTRSVVTGWDA